MREQFYPYKHNKNKQTPKNNWWSKFGKYFVIIVGVIAGILAIFTDGFQVWTMFQKEEIKLNEPIIDIRIEPVKIAIQDSSYLKTSTIFSIQTSKGSYHIIDIKIDSFAIEDQSFFYDKYYTMPSIEIQEILLDRRILDYKIPDIMGILRFNNRFVLSGEKLGNMYYSDKVKTIAKLWLNFSFKFESNMYNRIIEAPIIVYDKKKHNL